MATFTITIPSPQDQRYLKAVGINYNLKNPDGTPRDATGAEGKQWIMDRVTQVTKETERYTAGKQAADAVTPITPS